MVSRLKWRKGREPIMGITYEIRSSLSLTDTFFSLTNIPSSSISVTFQFYQQINILLKCETNVKLLLTWSITIS